MQHIIEIPSNEMCFSSLEDTILADNPVRFVDVFAAALSLQTLDIKIHVKGRRTRPSG